MGRLQGEEEPQAALGEEQPERPGGQGEEQALGEDGADQPAARRPEGGVDGDLLAPPLAPHDEQIGDVDAGDEEDASHRPEEHPEDLLGLPHHHVAQRVDDGGEMGLRQRLAVLGGEEARQLGEQAVEVVLPLGRADARPQAPDPQAVEVADLRPQRIDGQGEEEADVRRGADPSRAGEGEARG